MTAKIKDLKQLNKIKKNKKIMIDWKKMQILKKDLYYLTWEQSKN
jgi:hypothetical protein